MKVDVEVAKPVDSEKRHKVYRNGKSYIAIDDLSNINILDLIRKCSINETARKREKTKRQTFKPKAPRDKIQKNVEKKQINS